MCALHGPDRQRSEVPRQRQRLCGKTDHGTGSDRLLKVFECRERCRPLTADRGRMLDLDGPHLAVDIKHQIDLAAIAIAVEIDRWGACAMPPTLENLCDHMGLEDGAAHRSGRQGRRVVTEQLLHRTQI